MINKIKSCMKSIRILGQEEDTPSLIILWRFLICRLFHGAAFDNFYTLKMYEMNNAKRRTVLTFRRMKRISDKLNKEASESDMETIIKKNKFNTVYERFVKRDWIYIPECTEEQFNAFVDKHPKFLAKPNVSMQGKGIRLLDHPSDQVALWKELSNQDVVVEAFIEQNSEIAQINPSSVNTIRLVTAYRDGKVIIVGGGIRCGGLNAFVDNFHNGGCGYPIDIETGVVVGKGRSEKSPKAYIFHPSTDVKALGMQIPFWTEIKNMVCEAAANSGNLGYIGWDVAVLPMGCEIIEANVNYPGTTMIQLDGDGAYRKLKQFVCGESKMI